MKETIEEKLNLLNDLAEIESEEYIGLPTGLLRHAILNAIPLGELLKFYLTEGSHINSVCSNICKRLAEQSEPVEMYDHVLEILKEADYVARQRFRPILESIIPKLDNNRQIEYVSYFLGSKYVYERNSAIDVADKIWNEEIRGLIVNAYSKHPNHKVLAVLVKHLDDDEALELVKQPGRAVSRNT